ncbi:sigma 54-interacting transcriptional regulator [Pendulispora albinea]|uniref:Sigma 54-interacting transcriptional regulator n=1 Tax=Pendulispora albinea TaxID=2741071 RepID=A0ABZ2LV53_9BACT
MLVPAVARLSEEKTRSHTFDPGPPGRPRATFVWEGGTVVRDLDVGRDIVIGRAEECDIQILHPSVSRKHARLRLGPPLMIEDLGSSNGTRIDGVPMGEGSQPFGPNQIAEIGAGFLIVRGDVGVTGPKASLSAPSPEVEDHFLSLIAKSPLSVLIVGETGVGKERAAEKLHLRSPRAAGPLVRLNCAAFPQTLLEAELFGYEKGAFTGAVQRKLGLVETAYGGTLFLDEVAEMPPTMQAALLRMLEARQVLRIGGLKPVDVDIRVVSATHRDLDAAIAAGSFRRDLYYRLAGATVRIPPLRARRPRILPLAKGFLDDAARAAGVAAPSITSRAQGRLLQHPWYGNVRELRSVMERAFALCEGRALEPAHLLLDDAPGVAHEPDERQQILDALEASEGNQTRAAEILGVSRRTLINRLEEYDLPRPRKRTR